MCAIDLGSIFIATVSALIMNKNEVGRLALQHESHEWESSITGELQKRHQRASQHLTQYLGTI